MLLQEGDHLVNGCALLQAARHSVACQREAADAPDLFQRPEAHQPVERRHVRLHQQHLEVWLHYQRLRGGLLAGAEIAGQHLRAKLREHEGVGVDVLLRAGNRLAIVAKRNDAKLGQR